MTTRWSYKVLKFESGGFMGGLLDEKDLNEQLDRMGSEGWELVSCFDTNSSHGRTRFVVAVLKRPV